jgi:predicted ATP-binding protein involved in virulence
LLELLSVKLYEIITKYKDFDIPSSVTQIKANVNFIEKHKDTFFESISKPNNLPYLVSDSLESLNKINIKNFYSIKNINLSNLKDKQEIYIVGENGDGKTLLLQAIVISLVGINEGKIFDLVNQQKSFTFLAEDAVGNNFTSQSLQGVIYNNLLAYGASRNNYCQIKEDSTGYLSLFSSEYDLKSPTKWLQYLDYSEQKENHNVIKAKEVIKLLQHLLNSDIEIDINPNKVTFIEKDSEVSFEQLSAGYRGVITIICDMIARLSAKQKVKVISDFQGIVLIDEVELHLHPKWQYGFMNKLREIFPLIQFIVTTHSSTVLLGASMEAVYYNIYKKDGVVKISEQKEMKNDFLNDIQSTVFGFDVNDERINNPTKDDNARQKKSKKALLDLIDTIGKEQ